jgi:phage shock protein A
VRRLLGTLVGVSLVALMSCSEDPQPAQSPSLPSPVQSALSEAVTIMCGQLDDLEQTLAGLEASPAPDPAEISAQLTQLSGDLQESAQQLSADGEDALASFATAAATAIDGLQAEIEATGSISDEQQTAIDAVQFALQQLPPGACA